MFFKLIVLSQFLAGIICLISFLSSISVIKIEFLKFEKFLTKASLLLSGFSMVGLSLIYSEIINLDVVSASAFLGLLLGGFLSLSLLFYSVLRKEKFQDEPN